MRRSETGEQLNKHVYFTHRKHVFYNHSHTKTMHVYSQSKKTNAELKPTKAIIYSTLSQVYFTDKAPQHAYKNKDKLAGDNGPILPPF